MKFYLIEIPNMPISNLVSSGSIAPIAPQNFTINCPPVGNELLFALWRSPDRFHQIGALDRQTNRFRNIPVNGVTDAVRRAYALSDAGAEAYFAPAEYLTPDSREAANVSDACGFWMDFDCGEEKAAAGKGYPNVIDAQQAVRQFSKDVGLPEPTHIVSSGGGLHVYWVLDRVVDRAIWQAYAAKLKRLTKAHGLLADDSRTADIASVLRIPGTLNFKYDPPRPVSLRPASAHFIEQTAMLNAIESAHKGLCSAPTTKPTSHPTDARVPNITGNGLKFNYGAPNLDQLASALVVLDPDCDDETWKLRRLAPLADAARQYPESGEALYELARSWSSGELRGIASKAWTTPGGNGFTGKDVFDAVWQRFLNGNYAGKPTTLGTIYYDATAAGWVDPGEQFEIISDEAEEGK